MLERLYIKNYALVDELTVTFHEKFNIITGETGAGKSILIDALSLLLGEKADVTVLRTGAEKAIVEGVFRLENAEELGARLREADIDLTDKELIVRREILATGRSRAFVNDTPVPNSLLEEIGDLMVDLHGQHEHQSLLKPQQHVDFLDAYGSLQALRAEVAEAYHRVMDLRTKLRELQEKEKSLRERRELFTFQLREINQVDPKEGEEEELLRQEKILQNSERLFQSTAALYQDLYEAEGSVAEKLSAAAKLLDELAAIDPRFQALKEECESARVTIEEIAESLSRYHAGIEFDPERLETLQDRLGRLSFLRKKYGGTLSDILDYRRRLQEDLALIENYDEEIAKLQRRVDQARAGLAETCMALSEKRKEVATRLEKEVVEALGALGMGAARFEVQIQWKADPEGLLEREGVTYRASPKGMDLVEFFISANPGEDLKPLAKVASGGEISRIMLALKSILADADRVPVLVFDEIDLGISGRVAQAVGRSLRGLSSSHQLICITHLPQIASMAHHHFVVEKHSDGTTTWTRIRELAPEERPVEIARLIGGEKITKTAIRSAEELLKEAGSLMRKADEKKAESSQEALL